MKLGGKCCGIVSAIGRSARAANESSNFMKAIPTRSGHHRKRGFTFGDLLIVILTAGLMLFLLPMFLPSRTQGHARLRCISRLKQIGLAFRMWSGDHEGKFPTAGSMELNGTLATLGGTALFLHYQFLSNELNSPKILVCPTDTSRTSATNFTSLNNNHLSYFVGLDADETAPQSILSGDRNLTTNGSMMSGLVALDSNSVVTWTKDLHRNAGNIGLGDGSAQQTTPSAAQRQFSAAANWPVRLAIP